jgi:glycerol-3-phosphate dehydrogenase (NAD(P)+)
LFLKNTKFQKAIVIGGGAFGTAMAQVLSSNFKEVYIIVRSRDIYDSLLKGENQVYLPGHKLSKNIHGVLSFEAMPTNWESQLDLIVSALPLSALKSYFTNHQSLFTELLKRKVPFLSLSKGINSETLELSDQIYSSIFPKLMDQFAYLSGPSFAQEIVKGQITLVSIAGSHPTTLKALADMLSTPTFKAFLSFDVKGHLLGGALKNVLAIAGGIVEGLGYNHNTRAAMITRGIIEMLRFGKVFNARPETFYGLSGMGDLILTTTGEMSRNKSFGLEIAKGRSPKEILTSKRRVVEGYYTTKATYLLAQEYEIRCLLFDSVYDVLYREQKPTEVLERLMKAEPRMEID